MLFWISFTCYIECINKVGRKKGNFLLLLNPFVMTRCCHRLVPFRTTPKHRNSNCFSLSLLISMTANQASKVKAHLHHKSPWLWPTMAMWTCDRTLCVCTFKAQTQLLVTFKNVHLSKNNEEESSERSLRSAALCASGVTASDQRSHGKSWHSKRVKDTADIPQTRWRTLTFSALVFLTWGRRDEMNTEGISHVFEQTRKKDWCVMHYISAFVIL